MKNYNINKKNVGQTVSAPQIYIFMIQDQPFKSLPKSLFKFKVNKIVVFLLNLGCFLYLEMN